jgi:hypothetical protein
LDDERPPALIAERTARPRLWFDEERPPALIAERTARPRLWFDEERPPALMFVLIVRAVFVEVVI